MLSGAHGRVTGFSLIAIPYPYGIQSLNAAVSNTSSERL
jgi:hypothetical protein